VSPRSDRHDEDQGGKDEQDCSGDDRHHPGIDEIDVVGGGR
jgi:hypothetical protein